MSKIDIIDWEEFRLGDLFDIHPTKSYKMNNSILLEESGTNPVVVNSSYNNGIGGYSNQECTEKGNIITFSDTTSAESIFYQEKAFVGYPHVQGLYPYEDNKWNKYSYLFLVTLFREKAKRLNYDYVNKFTRESAKEIKLKIPIDINGEIDYKYMEKYMISLEKKTNISMKKIICANYMKNKIDIKEWKEFEIGTLFEIFSPKVYHTREVEKELNGIPYVVRSKYNNGIKYFVKNDNKYILNPSGVISFGAENASFFYQEKEYISGRDMYYIDTRKISKNASLFLISCLKKIASKYSYNFGLFPNLLKKEKIKLPITKNGTPDFAYMDKYMESINKKMDSKINLFFKI